MKTIRLNKIVKGAAVALALSVAATGCMKSEAERFGYKGEDLLEPTNLTFLVLSPTVTNWVPERVLTIYEKYDFTSDELAVIKAAGVVTPSAPLKTMPAGYARGDQGPWFAYWTADANQFGFDGKVGVLTHFNEDRQEFETSETYFSSYWKTKEEADVALAKIKDSFAKELKAKKFHPFDIGWIAEYVRLAVLGVVGQRADGTWTCMISIRDKGNYGCGPWSSTREQQARLNRYVYMKEIRAWREEVAKLWAKNNELVAERASKKGIKDPEDAVGPISFDVGRAERILEGKFDALKEGDDVKKIASELWVKQVAMVEKLLQVKIGEIEKRDEVEGTSNDVVMVANGKSDLYEVVLELSVPAPLTKEQFSEMKSNDESFVAPVPRWSLHYTSALQPEIKLPAVPQFKEVAE